MPWLIAGYVSIWLVWMPLRSRAKHEGKRALSTVWKVIPTLMAAGVALYACLTGLADTAAWLMCAGICLGAVADAVLEYRFKLGGFLFFSAHCLYIAAFLRLCPPGRATVIVLLVAIGLAFLFLGRYGARIMGAALRVGGSMYALTLCALLAVALPAPFIQGGLRETLGAVGAGLFVLSDALLCRNSVVHRMARAREAENGTVDLRAERRRAVVERLTLGCYYTAQATLALSVVAYAV
jgi:uncharacterized membrane protein YhhN